MDFPRISLEQWRALVGIVESGGYAQAAERLHKSQSTLTYAIQQLERRIGARAFEIQGRKAVLTPTGHVLYRRGKPADAATWFERAIDMDASRALAWLNLGDARLLAGDEAKAMAAYKTFLELSPKHARAAELQAWIANPSDSTKPKPM